MDMNIVNITHKKSYMSRHFLQTEKKEMRAIF